MSGGSPLFALERVMETDTRECSFWLASVNSSLGFVDATDEAVRSVGRSVGEREERSEVDCFSLVLQRWRHGVREASGLALYLGQSQMWKAFLRFTNEVVCVTLTERMTAKMMLGEVKEAAVTLQTEKSVKFDSQLSRSIIKKVELPGQWCKLKTLTKKYQEFCLKYSAQ